MWASFFNYRQNMKGIIFSLNLCFQRGLFCSKIKRKKKRNETKTRFILIILRIKIYSIVEKMGDPFTYYKHSAYLLFKRNEMNNNFLKVKLFYVKFKFFFIKHILLN